MDSEKRAWVDSWGAKRREAAECAFVENRAACRMKTWAEGAAAYLEHASSVLPWSRARRGWSRLSSKLLSGLATYFHGAWYPYGRISEGLLGRIRQLRDHP